MDQNENHEMLAYSHEALITYVLKELPRVIIM